MTDGSAVQFEDISEGDRIVVGDTGPVAVVTVDSVDGVSPYIEYACEDPLNCLSHDHGAHRVMRPSVNRWLDSGYMEVVDGGESHV